MKLKRVLAGVFSLALMFTMEASAFAAEIASSARQKELEYYAYMNLESVDEEMEYLVLNARNEIIMETSWVADGVKGYVVDENDKIVREVPHFYEVFPADWQMPVFPTEKTNLGHDVVIQAENGYWDAKDYNVSLKNPSTTQNTSPFAHFGTHKFVGTSAEYYIEKVSTSGFCCDRELNNPTYNVGYSNYDTGASLGLSTRMGESESFTIEPPADIEVAIRASTFSTPADWILTVGYYRVDV